MKKPTTTEGSCISSSLLKEPEEFKLDSPYDLNEFNLELLCESNSNNLSLVNYKLINNTFRGQFGTILSTGAILQYNLDLLHQVVYIFNAGSFFRECSRLNLVGFYPSKFHSIKEQPNVYLKRTKDDNLIYLNKQLNEVL